MAELVVVGPELMQRWRRVIPVDEVIRLGRAPRSGWAVPWDWLISREHAELHLQGDRLKVRRLDAARNPIYFDEVDTSEFLLSVGAQFRIGKTTFRLAAVEVDDDFPSPFEERTFHRDELKSFAFDNADHRLEVLSTLPRVISHAVNDEELGSRLASLLLEAIPHAQAAALVQCNQDSTQAEEPKMTLADDSALMRWDSSDEGISQFSPSRRLINAALQRGKGILHVWHDSDKTDVGYTRPAGRWTNLDWAFCMPFKEEACKGWCLYVSGQSASMGSSPTVSEDDLKGDLRFTEMVSEFIGAIRQVRLLEQRQAGLSQFFSPAVMETLRGADPDKMLEPKESDITVLFCDVRGFSKKSEASRHDLKELLDRVSDALGVMTCGIIKHDGVIADFQGDAALGFWGWPTPLFDGPLLACRAALEIEAEFKKSDQDKNNSLAGFQVGIGIAHGPAIAGKIGTDEQVKVGAFGPVVNLGSRLESMTKQLWASILIDEPTARFVRDLMPRSQGRCRRLGRIRPYGMEDALMVSELLPPADCVGAISDQHVTDYEAAVDAVMERRWDEAIELLDKLPDEDRTKDFLRQFLDSNHCEPPIDWDGVVEMVNK